MICLHDNTINMNLFQDVCSNFEASSSQWILCRHQGTLTNNIVNYNISRQLLLLSADVETNPGPVELGEILQAIQSSERNILEEIRTMKLDIIDIKSDMTTLKNENENMKINMKKLNDRQSSLAELIGDTNTDVTNLKDNYENVTLDIEHLNEQSENNSSKLEQLEEELEKIQVARLSSNMRFFGLDIKENEQEQVIIDTVFKQACPAEKWEPDDIKSAHVITVKDKSKPPLIIAKLRYDDDKFKIYKGRSELRKYGIRVGDDLTKRQRDKLKLLKNKGKTGYYYKGKLHVRDETESNLNNSQNITSTVREYRLGNRKLTDGKFNLNSSDGMNDYFDMQTESVDPALNANSVKNQR